MSEIKRVAVTTLEPQKVNDKVIKKLCKTVRISVILPESNEDNCPEYNYKDQLAAVVKKKVKPAKEPIVLENGLDPYGDNDEDVKRIALEMEAKYGSGVTKKKRKERKDDYADIGMGYDESDSFIDNTDGYDEIIPKNVTTLHGGFYVNSGALEFKTDDEASSNASSSASSSSGTSSASESEGEDKQKPKNRKRILETSADSDSDTANPAQKEKKLKVQSSSASIQQAIKKKLFSTSKIQVKKRRPIDPLKKTVKDLLREKREDLNMSVLDELKTVEDNIEKESSKENKKPMNITSVTDAIESVLKQVIEENYDTNQSKTPVEVIPNAVMSQNKIDPQISQSKDKQNLTRLEKEDIIKLPDNLPPGIEAIISILKEAALNYKGEGKKAFFTQEVNAHLLNLEKKSKIISKSSRVKVYEHLAQYVNCTKDTLIRRARILDLEDHERRLKVLQNKLKECIEEIMPTLEESYQLESQKVIQKKFSNDNESNEDLKALKIPRRKFIWTEETKKRLKDVVSVKKRCLILEGKCKDNVLEQQLVDYLRTHIQPLWPEGWMYLNVIKKILNSMQDHSKSSANSGSTTIKSSKHSNISITPVTNGKSNPEKPEITNSITVTKVVNNNEVIVVDSPKVISKNLKINHFSPDLNIIKEVEKVTEIPEQEIFINEHTKSNESLPKVESNEKSSDFTIHPKKSDVFKPYVDDPPFPQSTILFPDTDKIRTYQKTQKQNEMFKPYADEVISVERSIPDKPKIDTYEDIPQYSDKEKFVEPSYVEIDRHGGHSLIENEKQSGQSHTEKEKQSGQSYTVKEKHGGQLHQEKDKLAGHSYSEKKKQSGHLYQEIDEPGGRLYQEKDKQGGHSYHEKDKHVGHSSQEKDKHGGHSYREKEKHGGHSYNEKDKHGGHSYREKDKHGGHSYQEKDKHSGHSYREKDKHGGHSYREKNKHGGHSYHDKDKHSGHSYNDKEKSSSHSVKEIPGSTVHNYMKKDKYAAHTYPVRDEQVSLAYSERHNPNTYAEKEKLSIHSYPEKEKSTSHSYSDKHRSHTYSEKDVHSTHTYVDKDKHNSHMYVDKHSSDSYTDKDKHAVRTYSDKDKHPQKDKKLEEEKPINHPEITPQLDIIPHAEKLPSLPLPMEKPTDLSKFQMFKPYSDTPKSLLDAYQPKDVNCYKPKEERHHRNVEMTKSLPQDSSKFSNKSFVSPGDFMSSRGDVSSTKHRSSSTQSLQVGNYINELPPILEDSGVIIKNLPVKDTLPREDKKETQIGLKPTTHCQGVKRKLLESYARNSNEMNSTNYYSATVSKHSEYVTSTPLVTSKSEGDGQKDIQMVMENLKALQKLSCSPAKNDSSSSSPVSVIAYNKNFTSSKTSSSHGHSNRNDINNRGDFTGGFQEEFQKAFINSLQQMAASNNKSSNNNSS